MNNTNNLDTFNRFQEAFKSRKTKASEDANDGAAKENPFGVDHKTKAAVHHALKIANHHTFHGDSAKDKDFDKAKSRHEAICALADPANDVDVKKNDMK